MAKGDSGIDDTVSRERKTGEKWTYDDANPNGVYSGMTKRLRVTDGSFVPHGEVDNELKKRR